MMDNFIYDGSFTGFLTLIYQVFKKKNIPAQIIRGKEAQLNLIYNNITIKSDEEKADQVTEAIIAEISHKAYRTLYRAFLSEIEGVERAAIFYLQKGFKRGSSYLNSWADEEVVFINQAAKKVNREVHRFKGLLRFRMLQEKILYAPFKPDYNISFPVAQHFKNRLAGERWGIHDKKRNTAVIYQEDELLIVPGEELAEIKFAEEEELYQSLWQEFFNNISIEKRKNLKLQKSFMPQKYWEYLVEKK